MSTRERWIVYPLLFLTLGIALRDKIVPPNLEPLSVDAEAVRCDSLDVGRIRCRGLTVQAADDRPCVELGTTAHDAGQLEIFGPRQKIVFVAGADTRAGAGLCQVADAEGRPQAQLSSTAAGGLLSLTSEPNQVDVVLGHDPGGFSLVVSRLDEKKGVPLTLPSRWKEVFPNP